ncbi:hypothetical protein LCGC14_0722870 [marine sediment metagenome]|uniref:Uncharacterized protein n=1 Tax=marine sediment metagenome TaxID=412755 RepID=A0A0F9TJ41_9ZZZZ
MSHNRFYIGKKDQADMDGTLEEWIDDKIPNPPEGTKCECDRGTCHDLEETDTECFRLATSYLYKIDGEHVCYTYVCFDCGETGCDDEYLADREYPVTGGGYAVTPRHCA